MKRKPIIADLFCGAGGAARGYQMAGFEVWGFDIKLQKHYIGERFYQCDVMKTSFDWSQFDAVHASPPCQRYSCSTDSKHKMKHPDFIHEVRVELTNSGLPWVIENVRYAPLDGLLRLCGCSVGLPNIKRWRYFESSMKMFSLLPSCNHPKHVITVCGHGTRSSTKKAIGRNIPIREKRAAMGNVEWMNRGELSESIPPAYTHFIGKQLMEHLGSNQTCQAGRMGKEAS